MSMSEKTLRQLLEEAADTLRMYRHPDISECCERLDEITTAAGLGSIGSDCVTHLGLFRGVVTITTEYSVRGCEQSDSYEFPEFIIDAAYPVKAAALWGAQRRTEKAKYEVDEARDELSRCQAALSLAEAELQSVSAA